jgi:hypothetical protein
MSTVTRKRKASGRITSSHPLRITRGFPPDRCPKCHEAVVGVRKCRCQTSGMPRGMVWINGILRFVDGCANCGSTLHTTCSLPKGRPEFLVVRVPK